jgi:multidrug efflux pump subunit AcrA (membrane-fusion protein)
VVKIIDEVNVSVQESGIVLSLEVREGMNVEVDAVVGRVDDGRSRMEQKIAEAALAAAERKAQNDVEIRHAEDAAKVAEFEYRASLVANERSPNAVAQVRLNELALAYQKAMRQIELAKHNQELYKLESAAKRVEAQAAEDEVRRRRIKAPIAGQVTEVPVHVGQWVQPGDPVFRIVRLDRLSVDGLLNAADYAPNEIVNRPVVVEGMLARGRRAQFVGKVTFVHPEIDNRGKFRIKAEITNIQEDGQYLLFPGKEVDLTIRLDQPPAAPASPQFETGANPGPGPGLR